MKGDISDQLKKAFIRRNEEVRFDREKKERIQSLFVGGYLTHITLGDFVPQKKHRQEKYTTIKIKGFFSNIIVLHQPSKNLQ